MNVAPFYDGWRFTNDRLIERIGALSPEQLALRASPDLWPIWAIAAHAAMVRVYWLCDVCKEPGAERTPFTNAADEGWEDDLTHPRGPGELVLALESTWAIVEDCLNRWTPDMLQGEFRRVKNGEIQIHTRQSVLMRLLTHDAYHCAEIGQTLGMHGLPEVDIWTGRAQVLPARN
ncbi:MAG: hypothetical protein QOJ33_599 [Chloroflexota bacterium]|jgi:uncharacterized damage-inducible protein DinB|nr:hypothetical protein [Chloroflexota bacterium]